MCRYGVLICGCVYVCFMQCFVVCIYGFRNVWVCVCMCFVMSGCVYDGISNVWVCLCMGFVMYVCVYVWFK